MQSIEQLLSSLTAAIAENTAALCDVLANAGVPTVKVAPAKAEPEAPAAEPVKPKAAKAKLAVVETPVEETPVEETPVEDVPEAETPAAEVPEAAVETPAEDYSTWDEADLRKASQNYLKGRLVEQGNDKGVKKFKDAFAAALEALGVAKASHIPADKLAAFHAESLTW